MVDLPRLSAWLTSGLLLRVIAVLFKFYELVLFYLQRKKLSKVKRSSQMEASTSSGSRGAGGGDDSREEPVDTCRVCKLRLEANRKYTHERFLVCANCNAKREYIMSITRFIYYSRGVLSDA